MLEGMSLDLAIESFFSCFITSLVYKEKLQKNGVKLVSYASSLQSNREYDGKENCAQVLEEEVNKMFGTKYLNDEHDCNVVSMNSLNIHSTNDDCTSYDENVSFKHVDFCGVDWVCKYTPNREDRYCKRHKYLETKWSQERLNVSAENLKYLYRTCELCN